MNLDQALVLGSILLAAGYLVFRKVRTKKKQCLRGRVRLPQTRAALKPAMPPVPTPHDFPSTCGARSYG